MNKNLHVTHFLQLHVKMQQELENTLTEDVHLWFSQMINLGVVTKWHDDDEKWRFWVKLRSLYLSEVTRMCGVLSTDSLTLEVRYKYFVALCSLLGITYLSRDFDVDVGSVIQENSHCLMEMFEDLLHAEKHRMMMKSALDDIVNAGVIVKRKVRRVDDLTSNPQPLSDST